MAAAMGVSSSQDLHPTSGARFVFERLDQADASAPSYRVVIYLPDARTLRGELGWVDTKAELRLTERSDDERESWARGEALKLARVLKKDPKPRLTRWRG